MDIRVLRYFVVTAQEANMTRAAEKLNMSQPPLSNQIKALEEELGVELFIRGKRRLKITEEGQQLYRRAVQILELTDRTLEEFKDIPFEIKRVYYMYDTGEGVRRGFHAHKSLQQILVCIHGSCKILLDNGREKKIIPLEKPYEGLYIANNMWREMFDFSPDAVLLVLASDYYNEADYIRNYDEFLRFVGVGVSK